MRPFVAPAAPAALIRLLVLLGTGAAAPGCLADFDGPLAVPCGNGRLDPGETCDDGNLEAGDGCDATCQEEPGWTCGPPPAGCSTTCGDGVRAGVEVCDGSDLAGSTCAAEGWLEGELACRADCAGLDASGCAGRCGDGVIDRVEVCEPGDLAGQGCTDLGFYGGTLACGAGCRAFDTSTCTGRCGDGVTNGTEVCDGDDVGTRRCPNFGFFGGTLRCQDACDDFDLSACEAVPRILVNEVVNRFWDHQVELVNRSEVTVQLDGFFLVSTSWDQGSHYVMTSVLPAYALGPLEHVVLRDNGGGAAPQVVGDEIRFPDGFAMFLWPYALEVRTADGAPTDFFRVGGVAVDPSPGTGWAETPAPLQSSMSLELAYVRYPDGADTDAAGDFCLAVPTPGATNDTLCEQLAGPGGLVINEVAPADGVDRLELLNLTGAPIDLLDWTFATRDATGGEDSQYLPSVLVPAGGYLLLVGDLGPAEPEPWVDGDVVHLRDPGWIAGGAGAVLLIESRAFLTVDYVRWGGADYLQLSHFDWSDTPGVLAAPPPGLALGRTGAADTNTAADFCPMPATIGSDNAACQ
jgi:cysteine-rich repeat protein